jgi:hypothetical protein
MSLPITICIEHCCVQWSDVSFVIRQSNNICFDAAPLLSWHVAIAAWVCSRESERQKNTLVCIEMTLSVSRIRYAGSIEMCSEAIDPKRCIVADEWYTGEPRERRGSGTVLIQVQCVIDSALWKGPAGNIESETLLCVLRSKLMDSGSVHWLDVMPAFLGV